MESILDDIPLHSVRRETHVSSNVIIGLVRQVCDVTRDWKSRRSPFTSSGYDDIRVYAVLFGQTFGEHNFKPSS
jgi:hypothetical protein